MPLYEYYCSHCASYIEERVSVTAAAQEITCPNCGKTADRVYSAPAIHFKGSGFHNTDYKRKQHHGAKDESTPQEVKANADKTSHTDKPAGGDGKPARQAGP